MWFFNSKKTKKKEKERKKQSFPLYNSQKRKIIVILLFFLDIIIVLSILNIAGRAGIWIVDSLFYLIGWGIYVMPLILASIALAILKSSFKRRLINLGTREKNDGNEEADESTLEKIFYIGTAGLILSFQALLGLFAGLEAAGVLGFSIAKSTKYLLGFWGSATLLCAILLISLVLLFNISVTKIFRFFKRSVNKKEIEQGKSEKVEEEEEKKENEQSRLKEKYGKTISFIKKHLPGKKSDENEAFPDSPESILPFEPFDETKQDFQQSPNNSASNRKKWQLPPLTLLDSRKEVAKAGNINERVDIIKDTLSDFNINVEMGDVKVGPTVSQYTLKPDKGMKLNKIITLHNDLALALAAHPIRIEAPIPGKSQVGIEVPNEKQAKVHLKEIISSDLFEKDNSTLSLALGKDVAGATAVARLDEMPHLLVAGATGSGKSIFINDILISLLYQNSPDQLKVILIDPKRVELERYNGLPHLLAPVIVDPKRTITALKWTIQEMEKRYDLLASKGKRDILGYNKTAKEIMPYIIIIIDELADLMLTSAREVEALVVRLAQMARAVGIHLILATQRPSVEVITGLIKANITTRIAFKVASQIDSRTIVDAPGAEKLVGRGDMLFMTSTISKPKRIQAPFNHEKEVRRIINFIKTQNPKGSVQHEEDENSDISDAAPGQSDIFEDSGKPGRNNEEEDDKFLEAKKMVIETGKASATYLQRRLRIGYSRAARLLDMLEEEGTIGPANGSKPREILAKRDQTGERINHAGAEENNQKVRDKWRI